MRPAIASSIEVFIDANAVGAPRSLVDVRIGEERSFTDGTVRVHRILHPDVLARIRDIENFLVRGKCDPVWPRQILDDELNLRVIGRRAGLLLQRSDDAIHAVDLHLFQRVVVLLCRQSVRRIGEIERTVGLVDEVVGTAEFFSVVRIGEDGDLSFRVERFEPPHVAARVACDRDAAFGVDRHPVRAGLGTFIWLGAFVAARMN